MTENTINEPEVWPEWVNCDDSRSAGFALKSVNAVYEVNLQKTGNPAVAASLTVAWAIHRAALNYEAY